MLEFLQGVLASRTPTAVTVDVNGVGYSVKIPLSTFEALPSSGQPVRLLTHLHIREDNVNLYGFSTESEREIFRLLITVNRVGPTLALQALSSCSAEVLKRCIIEEDADALAAMVKGIGLKTARRLVLELLPSVSELVEEPKAEGKVRAAASAAKALMSLGESRSQAQKAVHAAIRKLGPDADEESLVREALAL